MSEFTNLVRLCSRLSKHTPRLQQCLKTSAAVDVANKLVKIEKFVEYIEKYGHNSLNEGSGSHLVEIGAFVLILILMQSSSDSTVANIGRWGPDVKQRPVYSPVYNRNRLSLDVFLVATKDIASGEELNLSNWTKYGIIKSLASHGIYPAYS